MRRRGAWVAWLLVVMAAAAAAGNVPPTMEDQYVTTVQDTPVTFEVRAQDEDIDATDPGAHPLRFVLVAGPTNGVLIGELGEVWYEGPHDAVVELTYVPAAGFVGIDVVRMAVIDPFEETGAGTVTIEIDVTERRAAGLLSGSWRVEGTWESETGRITAFTTQLTEVYRIGALTMKCVAQVRQGEVGGVDAMVFDSLRVDGEMKVGTLSVASAVAFEPEAADRFDWWRTTVGFGVEGVSLRYTLYVANEMTSSYQSLYAQASVLGTSVTNTVRLDVEEGCGFEFARNDTSMVWSWCELDVSATLGVTCEGFEQGMLTVTGLGIPTLVKGLTVDGGVTWAAEGKTLSVSMSWRPARVGCIRVYGALEVGGAHETEIEGFALYGVRMECAVGDVTVVSATSLEGGKNATMTGQTDYFEVVRLTGPLGGCCGVPGRWGVATYFAASSGQLFDWGMTTGTFEVALHERVSTRLELVLRSGELGDPKVEMSFGWTVRW